MQLNDWNDIQAFILVAQTRQIARAAKKMGVDATTIGRRLRRLETTTNTKLFDKTRDGLILTKSGEQMLTKVESMSVTADKVLRQPGAAQGPTGDLRISVAEGFGSWFLTRHIAGFLSRHPSLNLEIVASSGFLSPSKREADIAIVLSRPKAGNVVAKTLSPYALRLYASKSYLARQSAPESLNDLRAGHRLIGYIPDLLYAPELNYLNDIMPNVEPSIRSSSINAQHRLVAAGVGIAVLPCFIGDTDESLTPILPKVMVRRSFWLVTHKDNLFLERIKAGKAWLSDAVRAESHLLNPDD